MNTISNGELSDPLCDSVNRGLTLVRLIYNKSEKLNGYKRVEKAHTIYLEI